MPRLRERLKGNERGFTALTLAIVGMMFTTMLVIPFLFYVQTSLRSVRSAGRDLASMSCGSAAMEYTLWRIGYDTAFTDSLTEANPTANYTVPCDDELVPVTVTFALPPSILPDYLRQYAYADIVLAMDVTTSINNSEMVYYKQAADAIVDGFDLPQMGAHYRMGLTAFGKFSRSVVGVTNDATALHDGIDSLRTTSTNTCAVNPANYVYALRGNSATTFSRHDINNGNWITKAATPSSVGDGGGLAYNGIYVFALRGANTTTFWQYDIPDNSWSAKAVTPGAVGTGGALVYAGSYLYALQGNDNTGFYRHDTTSNTWTSLAATPAAVGATGIGGGALVYDGTYIYALRGGNTDTFWRYSIAGNSWTTMAATPAAVGDGGALVYTAGAIYALRGNDSTAFYRYDISTDTWTASLATTPSAIGTSGAGGGALAYDGTYVYALRGANTGTFWRYDIAANTWTAINGTALPVGDGGALVYVDYYIACETDIVAGLDGAADQYSTGLGDRAKVRNLMVFLTDGNDAGNSDVAIQTAAAATGARIFAVGVDEVFTNTLNAIASDPDADHVFYATTFEELIILINEVVQAVKDAAGAGDLYDVEIISPDSTVIRSRVLKTPEGQLVVISSQET